MRLEWSGPAIEDLQSIQDYIARDSLYYASRYVSKLISRIEMLSTSPQLGEVVSELHEESIRQIIYKPYRILYRLESKRVLILAIIHASRDFEAIDIPKSE